MAAGVSGLLEPYRPTWAEIDLDRLAANLAAIRRRLGPVPLLAVVKANGYGHGAVEVARLLESEGADMFGVALPEEGVELRRAGIRAPILLMGGLTPDQADLVLAHALTPAVYRPDQVAALAAAAERRGITAAVHLKIDTGMGRLGVPAADVGAFAQILAEAAPHLTLEGCFSHFAVADDPADPFTDVQMEHFLAAVDAVGARGLQPTLLHLANSAAVIDRPPARLTLARPGIILYGYQPSEAIQPLDVQPVLTFRSRIIFIKDVAPGTSLGYGRTYIASRPARIASLALGYDDGLPRLLSNRGHVLVRGHRAPIVGRISMDLTTIDVTDIPGAALGDEAIVIGRSGTETLGADTIAAWAETITWDILCGIGPRVPHLYRRAGRTIVSSRFADALA